jgi:hypothetical protein
MSPRLAGDTGRSGGRVAVTGILLVIVAVGMLLIVRARPRPEPFDPRSERSDGARALVLLLRAEGATVDVVRTPPAAGSATRVLVLDDRLDDGQRAGLLAWVQAGGVAVVADPSSTLHGGASLGPTERVSGDVPDASGPDRDAKREADIARGTCSIDALRALRGVFVQDGVRFAVPASTGQCFSDGGAAFAFTRPVGRGVVVGLGDNRLLTNALLRYADNSGLATALLAPTRGAHVSVLIGSRASTSPADVGTGTDTLADLVRPGVWMALLQLGIAFVVFTIARAVRAGRPVMEPRTVPLAGSELVVATGNLMQRARHSQRAGWLLRGELYREMCRRVGLPVTVPIDELDRRAAGRLGLVTGELAALLDTEVADPAQLLELSTRISHFRERIPQGAHS